jgi:altronate dehydratase large subunit
MKFMGFHRKSGEVGVRNYVVVFPTVICASAVAKMISREVPDVVCVAHQHGCGHLGDEKEHMVRTMTGFCANPNVAGVLLVGLGCELITTELMTEELKKRDQLVESINVQELGGTTNAVMKGVELVLNLLKEAAKVKRRTADISELIVGTHCGGSDTMSGLTANPALGVASDLLVKEGGTIILSETPELLGTEHILERRAVNKEVGKRILEITKAAEARINAMGVDIRGSEPSPGNIAGGLTTLEEKALGAIRKGGTTSIQEVVDFAHKPWKKGFIIMDGPAHDVVSNIGMIASGAQLIVFTTGRGTPIGAPVAPVIKVSSNSPLYNCMRDNIDINAGTILDGDETIQRVGDRIFHEIIKVASGKESRAEILGHAEFAIHSIGPTV